MDKEKLNILILCSQRKVSLKIDFTDLIYDYTRYKTIKAHFVKILS